jgi:hypothetical protein
MERAGKYRHTDSYYLEEIAANDKIVVTPEFYVQFSTLDGKAASANGISIYEGRPLYIGRLRG